MFPLTTTKPWSAPVLSLHQILPPSAAASTPSSIGIDNHSNNQHISFLTYRSWTIRSLLLIIPYHRHYLYLSIPTGIPLPRYNNLSITNRYASTNSTSPKNGVNICPQFRSIKSLILQNFLRTMIIFAQLSLFLTKICYQIWINPALIFTSQ